VAPAPPSQSLALVNAMIHLCHGLVVSHRYTLFFNIGSAGDDKPRPWMMRTAGLFDKMALFKKQSTASWASGTRSPCRSI